VRGLTTIPSIDDLSKAYDCLQNRSNEIHVQVEELALWSQWARFDPRLAEIWVKYISTHWREIPPAALNQKLSELPWPAAAGMLIDQVSFFLRFPKNKLNFAGFKLWRQAATLGFQPASFELYFIGTRAFAGVEAFKDALQPLRFYENHGYFGRDLLQNKAHPNGQTLISVEVRMSVLAALCKNRPRISIRDYRDALSGGVSRRQAEKDLENHPILVPIGRTKGRYFRVKRCRP
jgi:hypothetical protein